MSPYAQKGAARHEPKTIIPAASVFLSLICDSIGQKTGITDAARSHLAAVCREYGIDMDGVFYGFDNEWQEERHTTLRQFAPLVALPPGNTLRCKLFSASKF